MKTSLLTAVSLVAPLSRGGARTGSVTAATLFGSAQAGLRPGRLAGGTDSLFSVNSTDITRQKIKLMERVGHAFGINMDDFKDTKAFGRAVRERIAEVDTVTLKVIEARLGLPDLGVTIIDVVDAMEDPSGGADDKLDAALRRRAGILDDDKDRRSQRFSFDDIGRYRIGGRAER